MLSLKSVLITGLLLVQTAMPTLAADKTYPEKACPMVKPTTEHAWLQQTVGNWTSETEATFAPGQPPQKFKGSETISAMGPFWTVNQVQAEMPGMPFKGAMTTGYDADKKQYVATWIDTMSGRMWTYHGTLDKSQKKLTLETEGVCPQRPGKLTPFKDVIELIDKNHKRYTTSMMGDDGKWVTVMTSVATRQVAQ
jgi:hypothetical protein